MSERDLLAALETIERGEGRYSRDALTHCSNTVEDMRAVARAAIANAKAGLGGAAEDGQGEGAR